MAHPQLLIVRESVKELRQLQKNQPASIVKRIAMLIELKKSSVSISKRDLAVRIGVNHNSIQKWRTLYRKEGINAIVTHNRVGFKPSLINEKEHKQLEKLLSNPTNGLRGYKELLDWVEKEFSKKIKYTTLFEYVKRHFGTKIKVARKSHIKKDKLAVEAFKKTSVKSSKM